MKYSANRKYRDFSYEKEEEVSLKKRRPILFNKRKTILDKIKDFFKGK
jgi:hypothetical protein